MDRQGRDEQAGHGPHQGQPLATAGTPPAEASAAVVLVHGRGATAESILELAAEFDVEGVAYVAPQAAGNTWYPNPFLAPVESNQPHLSSALAAVGEAVADLRQDVPLARIVFVGFSQGACVAAEFVARNPLQYGGLAVLSGGLVGPEVSADGYDGTLEETPVFVGCGDTDPHVPIERVHGTAAVFEALDANVFKRIYEGMGHGINEDEKDVVTAILERAADSDQ